MSGAQKPRLPRSYRGAVVRIPFDEFERLLGIDTLVRAVRVDEFEHIGVVELLVDDGPMTFEGAEPMTFDLEGYKAYMAEREGRCENGDDDVISVGSSDYDMPVEKKVVD